MLLAACHVKPGRHHHKPTALDYQKYLTWTAIFFKVRASGGTLDELHDDETT